MTLINFSITTFKMTNMNIDTLFNHLWLIDIH